MASLQRTIPYTQVKYIYEEDLSDKVAKKAARKDRIDTGLRGTSRAFTVTDPVCAFWVPIRHAAWVAAGCQSNPETWGCGPEPSITECYKSCNFTFAYATLTDDADADLPREGNEGNDYGSAVTVMDPPECDPCDDSLLQPDASISVALNNPQALSPDTTEVDAASQSIIVVRTYAHKDYGTQSSPREYSTYNFNAKKKRTQYDGVEGYSASCACCDCKCSDLHAPTGGIVPNIALNSSSNLSCNLLGPGWYLETVSHLRGDTCGQRAKTFCSAGDCYYCAYDNSGPTVVTNPNQPGGPNDPPGF